MGIEVRYTKLEPHEEQSADTFVHISCRDTGSRTCNAASHKAWDPDSFVSAFTFLIAQCHQLLHRALPALPACLLACLLACLPACLIAPVVRAAPPGLERRHTSRVASFCCCRCFLSNVTLPRVSSSDQL